MVYIKEFLADPTGPDAGAEYIAIANNGTSTISLSGWRLVDKSGKTFLFSDYALPPHKQLRMFSSATKITLNNSGETVSLFDASGALIDELAFSGKALEGRAFAHTTEITEALRAELFDDLAATSLPPVSAPHTGVVMFWLPVSLFLALVAVVAMRRFAMYASQESAGEEGFFNQ